VALVRLLDWYVLKRYLLWLSFCIVGLWAIAVIIDLVETIDLFIDHEATAGQILRYYVFRSPYWIVLTVPIAALLATLFAVTSLAGSSELTAMKTAGIGTPRILRPIFSFALLFSGAVFLFSDSVIPLATYRFNTTKDEIRSYSRGDGSRRQVLLQDIDSQLVFARSYDHTRQRGHQVQWERRHGYRVAERAVGRLLNWTGSGWNLLDGTHYSFSDARMQWTTFDSLALDRLTLQPVDFARQQKKPEEMSYGELRDYVDRALAAGEDATRHLVDLHLKIAFPLTCFVMVLLGAPIAANIRSERANSFGLGILICFAFYSCVKAGQAMGWNEVLAPWLGAWIANIGFGLLGLGLTARAHK
jgi:lipopolysaccharide export system permease protein